VQIFHIQKSKLEIDGGAHHPEEQLEEVGLEPMKEEMIEAILSEEEDEKNLIDGTTELDFVVGCQGNVAKEENDMGDQGDIPFDIVEEEYLHPRRQHKKSQPLEQLDKVV